MQRIEEMDNVLQLRNKNLNVALSELLKCSSNNTAELQQRKRKIAILILHHLQHLQQAVVTIRRHRQQRTRQRYKRLRLFFMQKIIKLQSNYMHMFSMLRIKHDQLQYSEDVGNKLGTDFSSKSDTVRNLQFWEDDVPQFSDDEFLNNLHVTRSTFKSLCNQLASSLSNTPELKCPSLGRIQPAKCVGLALYFLASGERISVISDKFAMPRVRTIKCLKVFCNAVMTNLGKALRKLPQSEADYTSVVAGFRRECNMPAALVGLLGVCCIPLRSKGKYNDDTGTSLRMEFLLDDRMLFRELQLDNSTGKTPQMPMYAEPPNPLTQLPSRCINKRLVPAFVLAPEDQNYPLRPWLLQRYPDPVAPHEFDFNEVADHLQELSDCALHRLMSRWRFLSQPQDISFQTAFCIITAATALHNLLEELSEPHMPEWGNDVDIFRFKPTPISPRPDTSKEVDRAANVRDFLARTISSTEAEYAL